MNQLGHTAALCALAAALRPAQAGVVTPLSSNRTVTGTNRENLPQTTVSFTGPTTGPWQATALASNVNFSDPNFNVNGNAVAVTSSQQSNFSSAGVSFSGFVFVDYSAVFTANQGVSASNRCDTVFHVDGSCDYQFQSTFTSNNVSETNGAIFLRNNGTLQSLFSMTASGSNAGTLATGDYTLSILIQGNSGGNLFFDGRTQIDAAFTIPSPATTVGLALAPLALAARRRRAALPAA